MWLSPSDIDERGEEDGHLYRSTTDDVPDETLEGHPFASQRSFIPSHRPITQGGVDCINSDLGNIVYGGVDQRDTRERIRRIELLVSLSVTRSSRSSSKAAEWMVGSGEVDGCMFG